MSQEKLVEKIEEEVKKILDQIIEIVCAYPIPLNPDRDYWAKKIYSLFKDALPELATEAGYVKLAKDQSLPIPSLGIPHSTYECYQDLVERGWRKVIIAE